MQQYFHCPIVAAPAHAYRQQNKQHHINNSGNTILMIKFGILTPHHHMGGV